MEGAMPDETPEQKAEREAAEAAAAKKKDDDTLGEGGKRALQAERDRAAAAEKEAKAQKKRADDLEAESLSDKEKLEKKAADGERLSLEATAKLRKANALLALSATGLDGPKAKAAYRLLDGLEFDGDDEPTNLEARITAAKAEFSDAFPKAAKADSSNGSDKDADKDKDKNNEDDTHAGARRDAAALEEEAKMLDRYVRTSFPGLTDSGDREGATA
jgi:hypothetical protein